LLIDHCTRKGAEDEIDWRVSKTVGGEPDPSVGGSILRTLTKSGDNDAAP